MSRRENPLSEVCRVSAGQSPRLHSHRTSGRNGNENIVMSILTIYTLYPLSDGSFQIHSQENTGSASMVNCLCNNAVRRVSNQKQRDAIDTSGMLK